MNIFHTILYQPLFNLLIALYNVIPGQDIGFAIIVLTVLVKLALWPLSQSSLKSQKALQEIQPKLEALKVEFGDDKEKLAKAMMDLYAAEKVSPFSSCLPLLIQLPILIALYSVLSAGLHPESLDQLYAFIPNPGTINTMFLGIVDLTARNIPLAILAGIFQFFQTKMLIARRPPKSVRSTPGAKDEDMLASMNQSMMYFMPVMTTIIGFSLPGGLTLYWVATNAISILQQKLAFSKKKEDKTSEKV
jgi:YidC/Oxa1 family membrane protein insertase